MTSNPNWPEITGKNPDGTIRSNCRLKPGQTAVDSPDIIAQIFKAKNAQLNSLSGALCGGKRIYIIWVVEYQKRGLPHVHIAIKFGNERMTPEEIDAVISAEIPDLEEDATLVKRWMIHGHREERCFKKTSA